MGEHNLPQAQARAGSGVSVGSVGQPAAAHLLSVAPMMELTDRHFRYLLRGITTAVTLYSEMITAQAVVMGDSAKLLAKSDGEGEVVLQLGGDSPELLARAAEAGAAHGYFELNLNVGCPSPRVSRGNFGACLMAEPRLVGRCVAAMADASGLPVGVKHRIGIDAADSYDDLLGFVDGVVDASGAGVARFVVHARKAWLGGLSPKQNRTVPPLRYDLVHRLKRDRPWLRVELNGGVGDLAAAAAQLSSVDGVMIGRAAYDDPLLLMGADALANDPQRVAGTSAQSPAARLAAGVAVVERMQAYLAAELSEGTPLRAVTRHMLSLFAGLPGARAWRRELTEGAARSRGGSPDGAVAAGLAVVAGALERVLAASQRAGERASRGRLSERPEQVPGDDQVLDLVGALADAR